jgi:heptosyltransferase III
VLLLRRAVSCLRAAGHRVALLAPRGPGSALIGSGPAEADELLAWEDPATAALFADGGAAYPLRERLAAFDAAVAYTRSADLARGLGAAIPRVVVHDPSPPADAGHISQWLVSPLSSLGVPCGADEPPVFRATTAEREASERLRAELPARFLAVHPGSGSVAKSWPPERFARLVHELGQDRFLLIEGPADTVAAAALVGNGAVVARGLPPRVLGALLTEAAAFVGNDSGVTHLAAAWGAPTVALFGPTDPAVWAPVGPRVKIVRAAADRMDGISVEAVLAAVAALMNADRAPS